MRMLDKLTHTKLTAGCCMFHCTQVNLGAAATIEVEIAKDDAKMAKRRKRRQKRLEQERRVLDAEAFWCPEMGRRAVPPAGALVPTK